MHKIRDGLLLAVPGLFAAGVYLLMIPSRFSAANFGEDGGDLLAAGMTLGVPHPTGYPAYILLLRFFLGLPGASSYWKGALFSAIAAGLALILLAFYVANQGNFSTCSKVSAVISCMALAFSPLFWSQAVIVEVQALQAVFILLILGWIAMLEKGPGSSRARIFLLFLAFWGGLSLGNHLTILFLFPLVAAAQFNAVKQGLPLGWFGWQALAFLAGCLVLAYLPLAARNYPPVNWGNPQSASGMEWLLSGSLYQNMLFGVTLSQFLERLGTLAKLLWDQFNLGIIAAGYGLIFFRSISKIFRWTLIWLFLTCSFFYLTYASRDSIVYLVPAWIVFSIWIGEGFSTFLEKIHFSFGVDKVVTILLLIGLLVRIPISWDLVNPSRDTITADYLEQILAKAPPDALLVTISDYDTFPLWYGHFGERQRRDLRVVVYPLTQFTWYQDTLRHIYPDLNFPKEQSGLGWGDELVRLNSTRPVCRSANPDTIQQHIQISCSGAVIFTGDFSRNGN